MDKFMSEDNVAGSLQALAKNKDREALVEQLISLGGKMIVFYNGKNVKTDKIDKTFANLIINLILTSPEARTDINSKLLSENRKLKSMCKAAANEIYEHWDTHCNDEGYGPSNLMSRLEGRLPPDLYPAFDVPPKESEE